MPRIGIKGTNGVLNERIAFGCVFLITMIPIHTKINANKVPIDVISPTTVTGTKAANKLTNIAKKRFDLNGVRNFG
jgi:hypothetical protein